MEAIAWGADVSSLVLGPLTERPDADWYAAPPGKWCPAQIVHHLALGLEYSGRAFASRRQHATMRRRPRSATQFLAYHLVMDAGWLPSGRQAPEATRPAEHPDRQVVERQFRDGVDLLRAVAADEYRQHMRVRSPRWHTVCLPRDVFRSLVRPLSDFTQVKVAEGVPF